MRIFVIILFSQLLFNPINAQTFPISGDTLSYTDVFLRVPWMEEVVSFRWEISERDNNLNKRVLTSITNTLIAKDLEFGKTYNWRTFGVNKLGEIISWTTESVFTIGTAFGVESDKCRFKIQSRDRGKAAPGLLFFDYAEAAINRNGVPKWFIPRIEGVKSDAQVRDLNMTVDGTFTALFDKSAIEFDRDGNILWQAPNDGKVSGIEIENYHHEFTKLESGNYLVLGNEWEYRTIPEGNDSIYVEFGTVIEYNPEGKVVWLWRCRDYFSNEELFLRKRRDDTYETQTHMNSCVMKDGLVIVGFRDISRIVVIDKNSKKVLESYGGHGYFNEPHSATGFFRRQHSGNLLNDGSLAVLNNDSVMDRDVVSSAVIFSRWTVDQPFSTKLFEFKFDFDSLTDGRTLRTGNLIEMENGNLLINMGSLNRCIEITRSGELVSDLFIEKFDSTSKTWGPYPQYRVSFASSLYPFEFTSAIEKNEWNRKKKRTILIRVYNVGHKSDSYTISGSSKKKKVIAPNQHVTIEPGQYQDVEIKIQTRKPFEIKITAEKSSFSEGYTVSKGKKL